tara:strand:- start:136 stop:324 length:189 start_codon:yes stop_codon:yes gene_type:complete
MSGSKGGKMTSLLELRIVEANALKEEERAWDVYRTSGAREEYEAAIEAEEAAIEASQAVELF